MGSTTKDRFECYGIPLILCVCDVVLPAWRGIAIERFCVLAKQMMFAESVREEVADIKPHVQGLLQCRLLKEMIKVRI